MTIRDIAKECGVSIATVSRVINNSGYVNEETKKKVCSVIEKNHYVPNAVARSLSINSTRSIGVIVPDIENEFFSKMICGISEIAECNHYNIHFMASNENIDTEHRFLEVVETQKLDGVIITPVSESDNKTRKMLIRMKNNGVPIILVDRDIRGELFKGVFVDNVQGSYDGIKALIKAGHKKIAIIKGPETSKPGRDRFIGYKNALEDANIDLVEEYILSGDFKIERAYECTKKLLTLENPPTAIFSANNLTTLGCLKYFSENKIKIGKNISLLGFDDIETLKIIKYNLSVITRDAKEQGKQAMLLMLDSLREQSEQKNIKRISIPYQVILRGSEKSRDI